MVAAPVGQRLGRARLSIREIGSARDGDENLRRTDLAGEPVDVPEWRAKSSWNAEREIDKDAHIDRIIAMLDELEAHHPPPIAGEG
jgi:hypothetical protein